MIWRNVFIKIRKGVETAADSRTESPHIHAREPLQLVDMNLRFRNDGSFRVLQLADIQDGPKVRPDTIRLIEAAIREADPDLIVLTGDQIRGYDPAYINTFLRRRGERPGARLRAVTKLEARLQGVKQRLLRGTDDGSATDKLLEETRGKVRGTFSSFLKPVTDAGVPFAATYGNHDFQCGILADEQDDIYREFPGCLNPSPGSSQFAPEPGTFALPIEASDGSGRIAMSVMLLNSGDYENDGNDGTDNVSNPANASNAANTDNAVNANGSMASYIDYTANPHAWDLADSDGYGTPTQQAIDWLGTVQRELGARNGDGEPVPAIVFQHIPPQEFYDCLKEVPMWTPNAVEGTRRYAGRCYMLRTDICRPGSHLGEGIGCPDTNADEVHAMNDAGGYFALYCGHDHKNSFVAHVHDLDLGYSPTCGFGCYGPKSRLRGIRFFEFNERNPRGYVTRVLTWGELIGRYSSNEMSVFFGDHCATDLTGIRNELRRPQVFALLTGLLGFSAFTIIRTLFGGGRHGENHGRKH